MNNNYGVIVILSLIAAACAYFASNNLLIGAGVLVVFLMVLLLLVEPMFRRYLSLAKQNHECYRFVSAFIVSLSVSQSLEKSFDTASSSPNKEFQKIVASISSLQPREKLEYLATYFELPQYRMFLSLLDIYVEQGGDIIKISSELMQELTRVEETRQSLSANARKNVLQFALLWIISLAIVVFLRVGLANFFSYLEGNFTYLISIIAYFAFFLVSLVVYSAFYTRVKPRLQWTKRRKAK